MNNSNIKICTWNVNGIRASYDKSLKDFVKEQNFDILCLQETKAHLQQVEPEIQSLGFAHFDWSSAQKKGYSGVATFSKKKPFNVKSSIGFQKYENEGRIIWTQYPEFDLYNIYFPNGSSGQDRHYFKQEFLKDLHVHLKFELSRGKRLVVVGDYNIAHREIDVYAPASLSTESGFLPEERKWMDELIQIGFIDAFRELHPNEKDKYSWWSYKDMARAKNNGWRIDYVCISKNLKSHLLRCEILDQQTGSDHAPVVAELSL